MSAIREGVAFSKSKDVTLLRFGGGDGAWDTLDKLCSSELFLRDGQMIHTLWLAEDASPIADVYVCRDDEQFLVIAEGDDLLAHARANVRLGATIEDLGETHEMLSLHGPYSWELVANLVGGGVVGVPYLSMFRLEGGGWGFRAGKTGEYGYDLVVPKGSDWEAKIRASGKAFDLADASPEELARCRLENWFYDIRRIPRTKLTPIELQLQWRTSSKKEFIGSKALADHRARRRIITMQSEPVREGDPVSIFGKTVGEIVATENGISWALVDLEWAHAGIDAFAIAGKPARSVTPPVIDNRSLYVNPQTSSYRTR